MDVTNVMDLSRNEYLYEDSVNDRRDVANSYRKGQLDGIDIDGDFADWNTVNQFKADSNDNDVNRQCRHTKIRQLYRQSGRNILLY